MYACVFYFLWNKLMIFGTFKVKTGRRFMIEDFLFQQRGWHVQKTHRCYVNIRSILVFFFQIWKSMKDPVTAAVWWNSVIIHDLSHTWPFSLWRVNMASSPPPAPAPPLSSLRLLIPPLRLLTAAMWQVARQQSVKHYGMLEDFVSLVTEAVPQLLTDRQRSLLLLALRVKVSVLSIHPRSSTLSRVDSRGQ